MLQSIFMFESSGEFKQTNMEMQLSDQILDLQSRFIAACDALSLKFSDQQQLKGYHKERKFKGRETLELLKKRFFKQIQAKPSISDINIQISPMLNSANKNSPEKLIFNWLKIQENDNPVCEVNNQQGEIKIYNSYFPELFLVSSQKVIKNHNDLPHQCERRIQYSIVGINHLPADFKAKVLFESQLEKRKPTG